MVCLSNCYNYESTPKTLKTKKVSFGDIVCFRSELITVKMAHDFETIC